LQMSERARSTIGSRKSKNSTPAQKPEKATYVQIVEPKGSRGIQGRYLRKEELGIKAERVDTGAHQYGLN